MYQHHGGHKNKSIGRMKVTESLEIRGPLLGDIHWSLADPYLRVVLLYLSNSNFNLD